MRGRRDPHRGLILLKESRQHLSLAIEYLARSGFESFEDFERAQEVPTSSSSDRDYRQHADFDVLVHKLDLSTEGPRQIREMARKDAFYEDLYEDLDSRMDIELDRFIDMHAPLFHVYGKINAKIVWDTLQNEAAGIIAAIDETIEASYGEDQVPSSEDAAGLC